MIKQKQGLELSLTYLVSLFVMLFLLIAALAFFFQGYEESEQLAERLVDTQTQARIERQMKQTSQKLLIPEFRIEAAPKQTSSFIVAIKNVLDTEDQFTLRIQAVEMLDEEGEPISLDTFNNINSWFFESLGPYTLQPDQVKVISVPVNVKDGNARRSTLILSVRALCNSNQDLCQPYGYEKKIEVKILG